MKECYNSINLSIYLIISKNIFFFNYSAKRIIKIRFIKLQKYYQISLLIYIRRCISFLRSIKNDYFSIIIDKVFLNNLNNKIYLRIQRFNIFSFNNNIYIELSLSLSSSSIEEFYNYITSRRRTYSTREYLSFLNYNLNIKCSDNNILFYFFSSIINLIKDI